MTSDDGEEFVFETVADDHEEFIPEAVVENKEKIRLIGEILNNLSAEQKVAVQLFYYEEMSVRDVARFCECSEGTIKSRLNYARKMIKNAVCTLEHRHNTKLYSLASVPLFYLIFRHQAMALAGTAIASMKHVGKAVAKGVKTAANGAKIVAGKAVAIKVTIAAVSSTVAIGGMVAAVSTVYKDSSPKKAVFAEATKEENESATTEVIKPTQEETEPVDDGEHRLQHNISNKDYPSRVLNGYCILSSDMEDYPIGDIDPLFDIDYWIDANGEYFDQYFWSESDFYMYVTKSYRIKEVLLRVEKYEDGVYWIAYTCSNKYIEPSEPKEYVSTSYVISGYDLQTYAVDRI